MNKIKDFILTILGISFYRFFYKSFIYNSVEDISSYQFKKLKKLLIVASLNVPYYKKLFKKIDFDPLKDFKTLSDLKNIPILEQEIVKNNPSAFINSKVKNYVLMQTSGTSGIPFSARIDIKHWIVEQAVVWRQWKSFGYHFRDKIGIIRSYAPKDNESLIKVDRLRNFIYYSPYHLSEKNCSIFYKDMINRKIKFLRGYPSSIKIFASYCKKNKLKIKTLKGVLLASETLLESDKKYIKNCFDVPVINHYGLAECIVMIGNINSDNILYNYDDYGYLELIRNNNDYNMIGTNLNNFAMPLIRYNTNDIAISNEVNKESKINFQQLISISGRKNEFIITSKEKIPVTNIYTILSKYEKISKFQIIQNNIASLEILILCNNDQEGIISNKLLKDLKLLKDKKIHIDLKFSSEFKRFGEGKIPPFIPYERT